MTDSIRDLRPVSPSSIRLEGVRALGRAIHFDPRGFLVETMRRDDASVRGHEFAMSYTSVTVPGEFRDRDRWHVHRVQTDRFVVVLGEMTLALFDARPTSPTRGVLDVVRMTGAPFDQPSAGPKEDRVTYLVPIPPGVYHCIGNLSDRPFVLTNYPTELYDPDDEGRVPFLEVPISPGRGPFDWGRVALREASA
jgi:dTDP-4-dehydrorhamnose 3,5-epimerase